MKKVFTVLAIALVTISFAQSKTSKEKVIFKDVKVENVAIEVTVDSAEDIERTFSMEDIKEMLNDSASGDELSFKIICNGKPMSNGKKSHVSYSVDGTTDKKELFLKSVEEIRTAAIKYYSNKK